MPAAHNAAVGEFGRRFGGCVRAASAGGFRQLAQTLLISLTYVALGRVGLMLAVAPFPVAVFWPAAGLAIAACLTTGRRALPGVWLGAFALYLSLPQDQATLPLAALLALGATLEAGVAAALLRRYTAFGPGTAGPAGISPLADGARVLALLAAATTIGAAAGAGVVALGGKPPPVALSELWLIWWLAEFAGAVGLVPLLACLVGFLAGAPGRRDPVVLSLAGLLAGAGVFGFGLARLDDQAALRSSLRAVADELRVDHAAYLDEAVARATALRAYFEASEQVTAAEFREFARLTQDPKEVTRAVAWVPRVTAAELRSFESTLDRTASGRQRVFEQAPNGARAAVAERPEYFPVRYLWPHDANQRPVGFDLASETRRREAIERAASSGRPAISAPLSLLRDRPEDVATLVVSPVYRRGAALDTTPQRRAALMGVTLVAFYPARVLAEVQRQVRPSDVEIFVFDRMAGSGGTTLLAWQASRTGEQALSGTVRPEALRTGLYVENRLEVGGREWLMLLRPGPGFVDAGRGWNGLVALGFGWLLAATLLYYLGRRETQERSLRELEAARLAEAEYTARLLEQLPIGVALVGLDGHIIDANAAFVGIIGTAAADFGAIAVGSILPAEGSGPAPAEGGLKQLSATFGPVEGEFRHGSGHLVPVRVRGLRVEREGGPAYLTVAEDISERRKSEFQLAQAQKMEAIGQLTGGLAHDFNNMLGIVIGNLDLFAATFSGDARQRSRLDTALSAALRGADLTRALLAVARRRELDPEPVELNAWLGELLPLIRHTAGPNVVVRTELEGAPVVRVDPGGVASVILNLVLNARDAMPGEGSLTLSTARRTIVADAAETLAPGDYVALNVSDTGCGMSPEILARAIDPFFTTKERGRGTGLGLAMAHGFATQSGGDLRIFSQPGVGTTVKILLPLAANAGPQRVDDASLPRGSERVLVVDDELELLAVTADWLRQLGYAVSASAEPEAALATLAEAAAAGRPFALLVTDVVMPRMDGLALADAALAIQPDLPVLLVSGFADPDQRGEMGHASEILEKPFRLPELARAVRCRLAAAGPGVPRRRRRPGGTAAST